MPAPLDSSQRYMPGLDGIRAIAVLAIIAYNLGFEWLPGGLLGVSVFFTLSGYLITDLLLAQVSHRTARGVDLKGFWLARARRLLPALALVLTATTAWVTLLGPEQSVDLRNEVLTSIAYVNNWLGALGDAPYFARFEAPSPLGHLWSLSVVEQFYLVWPLLLLVGVRLAPKVSRRSGARPKLAALIILAGLGSAILMAVLYVPGGDSSRVYFGTDTRAGELMIGAALAAIWPSRTLKRNITGRSRLLIDGWGTIGLVVVVLMMLKVGAASSFLFGGGFFLFSIATALLVSAAAHPASRLGIALGVPVLRWIGVRSYGIYLWHLPIIVLSGPDSRPDGDVLRSLLQVAATFAVAAISWRFVEEPIRGGALGRLRRRIGAGSWRPTAGAQAALVAAGVIVGVAAVGFAGAATAPAIGPLGNVTVVATETSDGLIFNGDTACDEVVHVGDSTSEGLVSDAYLPDSQQIGTRYQGNGVSTRHLEVTEAQATYERFDGQPNAVDVATSWKQRGYDDCWVLAIGTNDVGNVSEGSSVGTSERIDLMMSAIGDQPTMWVNLKSQLTSGPLANSEMEVWNASLRKACRQYPQMRIFDWASVVKDEWFNADGVHYTETGYQARAELITKALGYAFPVTGGQASKDGRNCVIELPAGAAKQAVAEPSPLSVAFAGDITPGSQYGLPPDKARSMFGAVRSDIRRADVAIGNLEGTLSEGGASKCGADSATCFSFQAPPANADGLRWAGFTLMNLANNHALDFGEDGQSQTIDALAKSGIAYAGLPGEITNIDAKGTRVAMVGFAPYGWSNSVDDLDSEANLISAAKEQADIVIVVAHLGAEGADQGHTPSGIEYAFGEDRGDTRAFAHTAIDSGAALVLASGPHVLRGMERYGDGLIAYSLGNFAGWDNFSISGSLSESALLRVELSDEGRVEGGQIVPLRLVDPGIPVVDSSGSAISTINALSSEDFGKAAVELDADGKFEVGG